jgi:hypothetical protein
VIGPLVSLLDDITACGAEIRKGQSDKTATYTTEGLAAHLIKVFAEYVQKEIMSGGAARRAHEDARNGLGDEE